MIQLKPKKANIDKEALQIFLKAIEVLGGPQKLIEHRRLTWLPSLMEAAYVLVLSERHKKSIDEIAKFLGVTRSTVSSILRASEEEVLQRLKGTAKDIDVHIAGGLAKIAYKTLKRKRRRSKK